MNTRWEAGNQKSVTSVFIFICDVISSIISKDSNKIISKGSLLLQKCSTGQYMNRKMEQTWTSATFWYIYAIQILTWAISLSQKSN